MWFQRFLDSLATRGGQLFVLCCFVVMLLGLVLWVTWRDIDSQATTVIMSTFSAFAGALLGFLTGASVSHVINPPQEPPK
jgi:FtsH-binding integral membrane protein